MLTNKNKNLRIKSIRKGWGENSSIWKVGGEYARIEKDVQEIRWGAAEGKYQGYVYYIYDKDNNLVVEIEPCSQLTITYFRENE